MVAQSWHRFRLGDMYPNSSVCRALATLTTLIRPNPLAVCAPPGRPASRAAGGITAGGVPYRGRASRLFTSCYCMVLTNRLGRSASGAARIPLGRNAIDVRSTLYAAISQREVSGARPMYRAASPTPGAPFFEMRALGAQHCVVAVPWVDDRGVCVHLEYPAGDVVEQLGEISGLPRLADAPRE